MNRAQPHSVEKALRYPISYGPGSTPRVRGKGFLTSRDTGWLPEIHPLSLCGASRRCPPTETFALNNECSGLDVHPRVIHPFIRLSPSRRRAHILSVSSLGCVCLAWGVGWRKPPQELHTYLKVWYYIIVGEGECLPLRNTNTKICHLPKGNRLSCVPLTSPP